MTNSGASPEGVRGWLCHVLEPSKVERVVFNALETRLCRLIFDPAPSGVLLPSLSGEDVSV
jgi:hypothetical protein